MLGLTPGEAFVVGFVVIAVVSAAWWPRTGAAIGAALSGKRPEPPSSDSPPA